MMLQNTELYRSQFNKIKTNKQTNKGAKMSGTLKQSLLTTNNTVKTSWAIKEN